MLAAKDSVSVFLLLGVLLCNLASAGPQYREDPEYSSMPAAILTGDAHQCPPSVELRKAKSCVFPSARGRGRTSCKIQETIKATEKYCLKMDDPQNVICNEDRTTSDDQSSVVIHCSCYFDKQNLSTRYCHLYTY